MDEVFRCDRVRGIVSVVQTPFETGGPVDWRSLRRLVEDAMEAGVDGFLAPAVASEVGHLSLWERQQIVETIAEVAGDTVPLIAGASAEEPEECRSMIECAAVVGASACLVAVPSGAYRTPWAILPYFREVMRDMTLPLIVQDFELQGPGMSMATIRELKDNLPTLAGIKIETVPVGPKYTAVREAFGPGFFIAGGWAVQQMIEALDRGVDAMIPESSMVRVYKKIHIAYQDGDRQAAVSLFRRLLPILAFTNQEVGYSIAFFKRLLVRKGVFESDSMRAPDPGWDRFTLRIVEDLIDLYLALEGELPG